MFKSDIRRQCQELTQQVTGNSSSELSAEPEFSPNEARGSQKRGPSPTPLDAPDPKIKRIEISPPRPIPSASTARPSIVYNYPSNEDDSEDDSDKTDFFGLDKAENDSKDSKDPEEKSIEKWCPYSPAPIMDYWDNLMQNLKENDSVWGSNTEVRPAEVDKEETGLIIDEEKGVDGDKEKGVDGDEEDAHREGKPTEDSSVLDLID